MAWNCPYATRLKVIQSLACKKAMQDGVDYNLKENALTVFCACQRYCPTERRVINSDGAQKCFDFHSKS